MAPRTSSHGYVVISSGTLRDAKIASAGGLQNAVSAACTQDFETFAAAQAEGATPEQQFVVSSTVKNSVIITSHCVSPPTAQPKSRVRAARSNSDAGRQDS